MKMSEEILNIVFIVLLIIFFIYICKFSLLQIWKCQFLREFRLSSIPPKVKVKKRIHATEHNTFEIEYPFWIYEKKDGTADLRRNRNHIVWPENVLYLEKYKIIYKNPLKLYHLICKLRERKVDIEKCAEEKNKYNRLKCEKSIISKMTGLEDIVNQFRKNPYGFEKYCAIIFENMGYDVTNTPATNDGGYDLILDDGEKLSLVECKCYSWENKIGRPLIQKLVGANQQVKADRMVFITTSDFTKAAVEYAENTNVKLINGKEIVQLAQEYLMLSNKEILLEDDEWWLSREEILANYPADIV